MYEKIVAAAGRLDGVAHKTPVLTSRLLDEHTGNQVFLKCENFQRMGAFKFRGAYNAIKCLTAEQLQKGVITFSSGNHAQAVALSGQILGTAITVIVPDDAPAVKLAAAKDYGATIITYNRATTSREEVAESLISQHGYTLIPPFDHEDVIAGQGTAAKELIDEVKDLDYIFVQVGGGGLISGSAVCAKQLLPKCQVFGVEPELADDATRSFKSGELQSVNNSQTIADGLRSTCIGKITFPLIQKYVDDMVTVSEEEIIRTMEFLWTRLKIVVEPSGAVSLAPIFNRKLPISGKRIGVILSGGNADISQVGKLFAELR